MPCRALCTSLIQNNRKMRPSYLWCPRVFDSCIKPLKRKILNFHDGPQSYLLTCASQAAQQGRSAGTGQQESLKAIVEFPNLIHFLIGFTILQAQKLKFRRPHFSIILNQSRTWCAALVIKIKVLMLGLVMETSLTYSILS